MADGPVSCTIDLPYNPGDIVHIRKSASQNVPELYHHKHACEVVSAYRDCSQSETSYAYRLSPVTKDTELSALYHHSDLLPSPRGYENIDTLLGKKSDDGPPEWERDFGEFMRQDLELIDTCLSVVDFENDATKDWLRELEKGDIDRTNSVFAEMLLLYQLRSELGFERVQTNAKIGSEDEGKDVDVRVTMNDWDVWLEVYKPDYVDKIPEGGGFISPEAPGTAVGNKLRKKFDSAREKSPEDAIIILAVYFVENLGQGLGLERWLQQDYFDVGEYCDAFLTFSHLSFPTKFSYRPTTPAGEDCQEFFEALFDESTDSH